jgi:opacity protein-like surface antigen
MRTLKLTILALALAGAFPTKAAQPATVGMTPEQLAEFNRIAVKTEALEDGRDASGFKNLKISGYADVNYIYNFNKERGTFQFLVPNSTEPYGYDNSYFGSVALDFQKETDSGTKFRLTLIPARSTGDFTGAANIVHEATVSIPVSGATKIFAGQLPDWSGYEYLPPTQNKLITHNLLFDFTLPYVYTGVGIEQAAGKWVLKGMIANVNTPIRQLGEVLPVFVCRGDYTGGEYWGLGFACLAGNTTNLRVAAGDLNPISGEAYSTKDTLTLTAEVDGWYTRGDLTLNAHLAYGQQAKAAITEDPTTGDLRTAQWYGVSVLAAYKFTPRFEGILRGDYIVNGKNGGGLLGWTADDAYNGLGRGLNADGSVIDPEKGVDKYAVTAGMSYAINSNATFKLEYRFDGTTEATFGNKDVLVGGPDPKYLKSNSLVSTGVVVFF